MVIEELGIVGDGDVEWAAQTTHVPRHLACFADKWLHHAIRGIREGNTGVPVQGPDHILDGQRHKVKDTILVKTPQN